MASGDEPKSTSSTAPTTTSASTTTAATESGHAPTRPTPDREGDPESGFSSEWIVNHEENAARRQREVREASNGQQRDLEYRTFPQQQQIEVDDEEREYQHMITVPISQQIYEEREYQLMITIPISQQIYQEREYQHMITVPISQQIYEEREYQHMITMPISQQIYEEREYQHMITVPISQQIYVKAYNQIYLSEDTTTRE
jgi:hypothetical protein